MVDVPVSKKWRATWASLSERTGSGYVPAGTSRTWTGRRVQEFVEHECSPPSGGTARSWTCGCGREHRR